MTQLFEYIEHRATVEAIEALLSIEPDLVKQYRNGVTVADSSAAATATATATTSSTTTTSSSGSSGTYTRSSRLSGTASTAGGATNNGNSTLLPLHWACWRGASTDVIRFLVERYPAALTMQDQQGWTPLHWACAYATGTTTATTTTTTTNHNVQDDPNNTTAATATTTTTATGNPAVVLVSSSLQTIQYLVEQCPAACYMKTTKEGRTPLHHVCYYLPTHAMPVVQYLVSFQKQQQQKLKTTTTLDNLSSSSSSDNSDKETTAEATKAPGHGHGHGHASDYEQDANGWTALHYACERGASLPLIAYLAEQFPASVMTPNKQGQLPLHLAATRDETVGGGFGFGFGNENNNNNNNNNNNDIHNTNAVREHLAILDLLVTKYPQGLFETTVKQQWTPLHQACHDGAPLSTVRFLVDRNPATLYRMDAAGNTPLHYACGSTHGAATLETVQFLVQRLQQEQDKAHNNTKQYLGDVGRLLARNYQGEIPLHAACSHRAPLDVVRHLVEQSQLQIRREQKEINEDFNNDNDDAVVNEHPSCNHNCCIQAANKDGLTPLHVALNRSSIRIDVVQYLVEQCPHTVRVCDNEGRTPLHWACRSNAPLAVVEILVQEKNKRNAAVDMIAAQDYKDGSTPLHLALNRSNIPFEFVQYLVEKCPIAVVKIQDHEGRTPLHWACRANASKRVVEILVEQDPDGIQARDHKGSTPLHLAFTRSYISGQVVEYLVSKYRNAAKMKDYSGKTPLMVACHNKAPLEVIYILVKSSPADALALPTDVWKMHTRRFSVR